MKFILRKMAIVVAGIAVLSSTSAQATIIGFGSNETGNSPIGLTMQTLKAR